MACGEDCCLQLAPCSTCERQQHGTGMPVFATYSYTWAHTVLRETRANANAPAAAPAGCQGCHAGSQNVGLRAVRGVDRTTDLQCPIATVV
jgi:hypothetical protein